MERLIAIEGAPPNMLAAPSGLRLPRALSDRRGAVRNAAEARAVAARGDRRLLARFDECLGRRGPGRAGHAEGSVNAPLPLKLQEPVTAPAPLVSVQNISVSYDGTRSGFWGRPMPVKALDNISFDVFPGETLGLVGESGSGKSTTGRAILRRIGVTSGKILFKGEDITTVSGEALRKLRRHMQIVFQDPYASLNPRMKVLDIIAEPMIVHGLIRKADEARDEIGELLRIVGLPRDAGDRFPHAFSGGQRQRIGIARALALKPDFIVADEPVSALDVSVRAQVVNLLQDLQRDLGLTLLFIAHDLSVVRHISHRVAILYSGRLVETRRS